ncbi:nucleotidyltransferase domain-containing protein [Actinoplanes palleronii]|uniref:Nucleotidyltransferase n=1 Tax=Actinoplanes palleronii TaxID=113570 RepID=A0ABQ4B0H9_9ACTN|nr:nucleotidyltransferase domain-containing protein [Actinoplanes palleronii]GIE64175.1 nucleotidyltransferase [Actinoplanes palleronii]
MRLPEVEEFGTRLSAAGWVTDLLVAGSLATGDWIRGVSDLDLVAIVDATPDPARIREAHAGVDPSLNLGCVYVTADQLPDLGAEHPTWTHGLLVRRILSGVTRAELVRHGYPVFGREPADLLPPMTENDIRAAARAELTGYWAWAARRPRLFLDPVLADLALTSMARGRHALAHGTLLTKSRAVDRAAAPPWLIAQLRSRRQGTPAPSPRLRTAWLAWRDTTRTVRTARTAHGPRPGAG